MSQERYDLDVTDEHARESSMKPTRETATGGASRAVVEYGWASPPNHSFLYDTRNGDNCGMLNPPRSENPLNPNIVCTEVPGSDGLEDNVMKCCHQKAASSEWNWLHWFPGLHD